MQLDWNTPAGRALTALSTALRQKGFTPERPITVFGSAPLQITVDSAFLSADVDIFLPGHTEELKKVVEEVGLGKDKAAYYIEVVPEYIFRPGPNWRERATSINRNGIAFIFPAPLDILLAKLRRLEEKDIRAFKLVLEKTGHPTERELIHELRASYDLFYDQRDGRKSALWENTERLWPLIYGREIDIRLEITQPVLDQLASAGADRDYLEELRSRLGL